MIHVPDVLADPEYTWSRTQEIAGYRAALGVPLLRKGNVVGVFFIAKTVPQPFTAKQIELATTFADQAVIAIENTRLLNELRESLQQQTATADVLKVISRSAFDLQVVLDTLVKSAVQLCEADIGQIARPSEAGFFQTQAHFGFSPELKEELERVPFKPGRGSVTSRVLFERATVQIVDAQTDPEYKLSKAQKLGNYRSMIATPLLREGAPIGVLALARCAVRPFTDKQMALLTTFADQAVIAIENARLFDEVRARTDELSESLRQQTATAEVLQVISRSAFDLQPVFDTVAESCVKLCEAERAVIHRYDGELLRIAAAFNSPPETTEWLVQHPFKPGRHSGAARAALERRTIHIPDVQVDPEYTFGVKDVEPVRTVLAVPILKGDDLLGVIVMSRFEVRPLTDKQIALVETFADQSAIAIENVQLFEEVRKRTEALAESLQQQTATADVLKVISRSAFDLPTVLQTLVESASRLCEADKATVIRRKGAALQITEAYGFSQEFIEAVKNLPIEPTLGTSGRALLEGRTVHIPDVEADPDYTFTAKKLGDYRT
ncbi:MAG: GAF domain-containing protein, partial [Rhodoplanes sp.]